MCLGFSFFPSSFSCPTGYHALVNGKTKDSFRAEDLSDRDLVAACLEGEQLAWERLVNRYQRMIFSVLVRYGLDEEERKETFQTVCLETLKNLRSLRDANKIRHWLLTITIRECNDLVRKKYRHRLHDPEESAELLTDPADGALAIYLRTEREQILREAIAELPERCQVVIRLLFLEEGKVSYSEVAQRLGLSKDSIGSTRLRCLESLHELLKGRRF